MHIKYLAQSLAPSTEPIIFFFYLESKMIIFEEKLGIQSFKPNPNHFRLFHPE